MNQVAPISRSSPSIIGANSFSANVRTAFLHRSMGGMEPAEPHQS
jgi:hypothetical protein